MPIQLPEVKRIEPQDQPSVGRIQTQIPNGAQDMAQQDEALAGIGKEVIRYRNQVADQTADTIGTDQENKLQVIFKKKMYGDPDTGAVGLKNQQGNPTDLYRDFDDSMQGEIENLSKAPDGQEWSQETQTVVNRRLNKMAEQLRMQSLTEYGSQQKKYDDSVSDSSVSLAQDAMPDSTTYITPGDDSSYSPLQANMKSIRDARIAQALRYGTAKEDINGEASYTAPDGTVKNVTLSPQVQLQIKKDLSDGLYGALDNLIKTGTLDKAQAMKDKYEDYLDPLKRAKIEGDLEKADTQAQAFEAADTARSKGTDFALKDLDPEVRHKALQIINEDQRNLEAISERKSKTNYNKLANYIIGVQQSDTPFSGTVALENDPTYLHMIDNVTDPKQKLALQHLVDQPKDTSPAATLKFQNLIAGKDPNYPNGLRGMAPEDLALYKSGMSKADQKKVDNKFAAMNSETGAQMQQRYKLADKELVDQAVGAGVLQRDQFNRISGKDEIKMIQMRNQFHDWLDSVGSTPMTPKELQDKAKEFVVHTATGSPLSAPPKPKFQGSPTAPKTPPSDDVAAVLGKLSNQTRIQMGQEYKKIHGAWPTLPQLADYVKSQTGK